MIEYILTFILFTLGLYAILIKRNLIKIIIGLSIMEYSMNVFLILVGYKNGATIPVFTSLTEPRPDAMVDPVVQAMILTLVVMSLAVTFLLITIAMRIYDKYGTYDIRELNKLKG
ncbi:MAG: cation:proton antiporter [Elusimicrobia bacterium RIFOXYA2_FULL_39_19]|nr:MAG: cation:proton antiporter [Elusimicrobia bacterium RIFOXYA2_FULL_39_19]